MIPALEPSLIKCSKCQTLLAPGLFNRNELDPCPSCGTLADVEVFPALLNPPAPAAAAEAVLIDGESSCFYHAGKKASIVCEGCGRFLCALCDLELNGRHVCPVCLESGQKKAKFKDLENSRMLWDVLCLHLAILPFLVWPVTIISGPMTLFLAIRYRKAPGSITGKSNARMIIAGILGFLETAFWVVFLCYYFTRRHR